MVGHLFRSESWSWGVESSFGVRIIIITMTMRRKTANFNVRYVLPDRSWIRFFSFTYKHSVNTWQSSIRLSLGTSMIRDCECLFFHASNLYGINTCQRHLWNSTEKVAIYNLNYRFGKIIVLPFMRIDCTIIPRFRNVSEASELKSFSRSSSLASYWYQMSLRTTDCFCIKRKQ